IRARSQLSRIASREIEKRAADNEQRDKGEGDDMLFHGGHIYAAMVLTARHRMLRPTAIFRARGAIATRRSPCPRLRRSKDPRWVAPSVRPRLRRPGSAGQ